MTSWTSRAFRELQRQWYQRLAAEGFQDIERLVNGEPELKQTALCAADSEDRETYYRLLRQHVSKAKFESEIEATIMDFHAEGATIKEICQSLQSLSPRRPPRFRAPTRRNRNTVRYIIRRWEAEWGLRDWDQKALGLDRWLK